MPSIEFRGDPLPQITDVPIAPPQQIVIPVVEAISIPVAEADVEIASEAPIVESLPEEALAAVIDLASIAARYPILHNKL